MTRQEFRLPYRPPNDSPEAGRKASEYFDHLSLFIGVVTTALSSVAFFHLDIPSTDDKASFIWAIFPGLFTGILSNLLLRSRSH